MKKILIAITPFLVLILLTACNGDTKLEILDNPIAAILSTPSKSTTAYNKDSVAYVLSLDSTGTADTFTATASNYGASTPITYVLQIDKTGSDFANAQDVQSVTTTGNPSITVTVPTLYNVITNATLNATLGVKTSFDLRLKSTIGSSQIPLYSNTITVKINPLLALKPYTSVTPKPYYIIGLGDGNWSNSTSGIGPSMYPLNLVSGKAYLTAGTGTYTYTGYFSASRTFKLIRDVGSWDEQWGNSGSDGISSPVHNDSNSKNFQVPSSGYYTITLNSITNTLSIVAVSITPTSYTTIGLIGDFNSWGGDITMSPCESTNNHEWYTTVTFSSSGGCKFRADAGWTVNWGAADFPRGLGTQGGDNIQYTAGTYKVIFNDLSGCYYFIK
jgi:starch-binding outer membrane protein SusE/F